MGSGEGFRSVSEASQVVSCSSRFKGFFISVSGDLTGFQGISRALIEF